MHRYHWNKSNCYDTTITLFDQNRKYYNQNNTIFHHFSYMALHLTKLENIAIKITIFRLFSYMALQAAPLIHVIEPLNPVSGSSFMHNF